MYLSKHVVYKLQKKETVFLYLHVLVLNEYYVIGVTRGGDFQRNYWRRKTFKGISSMSAAAIC